MKLVKQALQYEKTKTIYKSKRDILNCTNYCEIKYELLYVTMVDNNGEKNLNTRSRYLKINLRSQL